MPSRRCAVVPAAEAVVATLQRRRFRETERDTRLSSWPQWRQRLHRVVRQDVWFERIVFLLILANCVTIALDNLFTDDGGVLDAIEAAFTIIFLFEMVIKIVARGPIGKFGYFASNVNRFDFVLVLASTYGMLQVYFFPNFDVIPAFTATAARSARLLRPIRSLNVLGTLRIIVDSILASANRLAHLFLLIAVFALAIGLVALEFYRGAFQFRCVDQKANWTSNQVCAGPMERGNISYESTAIQGYQCPDGLVCADVGNPVDAFTNFDYVYPTGLTLFSVLMLEDWSSIMYDIVDSDGLVAEIYFLVLVLVGTMFLLNLVLATVSDAFTTTLVALRQDRQRLIVSTSLPALVGLAPWRLLFVEIVQMRAFQCVVVSLTLANVGILASVYHGMNTDAEQGLTIASVVLAFFFLLETLLKLLAKPLGEFMSDPLNPFDALLSLGAIVEFFVAGTASVNALRSIRLLRLLEISQSMKRSLRTLSRALRTAAPLLLLLALVIFLFALLGMQLFSGSFCGLAGSAMVAINTSSCENVPRLNYDNVGYAAITTFTVIAGDGWRDVMMNAMRARGDYVAIYFIACVLVGGLLMINLFIAVLLHATSDESSSLSTPTAELQAAENDDDDAAVVLFFVDPSIQDSTRSNREPVEMAEVAESTPQVIGDRNSDDDDALLLGTPVPQAPVERKPKKDVLDAFDVIENDGTSLDAPLLDQANSLEDLRRHEAVETNKNIVRRACRVIVNSRVVNRLIKRTKLF
jgi:hypothetical protein